MSTYIVLRGASVKDDCTSLNVQLHKTIRLRGEWEVGVITTALEVEDATMMWLFCDVVDYSIVNNLSLQLLDIVPSGIKKSTKPMYVRVIKKTFSSINVDIQKYFNNEPKVIEVKEAKVVWC